MKFRQIAGVVSVVLLASCDSGVQSNSGQEQTTQGTSANSVVEKSEALNPKSELKSGVYLENFDRTVKPQHDFYRYVNGEWLKKTTIPDDRSEYGTFTGLADKAQQDLRAIIEESAQSTNLVAGTDEQKVGDLYNSVLDTATLEQRGISPLKPYLNEISEIQTKKQLAAYFARSLKISSTAPFGIYINNDAKEPTQYIGIMYQSGLGLPNKDYYFDEKEDFEKIRVAYVKHIETMFQLAGLKNSKQAAEDIMALETAIAHGHWNKEDNRDSVKTYNKIEMAKMSELGSHFDWTSYFKELNTKNETHLIVRNPTYITAFDRVFADTSLEAWKTYATWHLLTSNASLLTKSLDDENFAFYGKVIQGTPEQKPRWKRAVDAINSLLGEVVGKVYVSKHFKPEAKQRMMVLVENLRAAYKESIVALDWMSEETKKQALDKLSKFRPKIGYPDKWRDYSQLSIQKGKLLENYMSAREFTFKTQFEKLGSPIDRDEWFMTPQTVNAYYNPVMNEIVFPAAILQPPFFDMDSDDAVNYGGIGAVIGHEMGHGFDDQGATYDGDGVLRNWWTEKDLKEFKTRTESLAAQYDKFEALPEVYVNGKFTLGENIGDLGGLTIAYKAYQLSKENGEAPVLDGFTGDQRFFIGWAQVWARKYRDAELKRRINVDPHSPSEFRANGVIRNMPEFVEAFKLKKGDQLYLAKDDRVKIW